MNGWTYQNQMLRFEIIKNINPDIACINETHLKDLDTIELTGYTWFGFHRPARHVNAPTGKALNGLSIFVKDILFNTYNIHIVYKVLMAYWVCNLLIN